MQGSRIHPTPRRLGTTTSGFFSRREDFGGCEAGDTITTDTQRGGAATKRRKQHLTTETPRTRRKTVFQRVLARSGGAIETTGFSPCSQCLCGYRLSCLPATIFDSREDDHHRDTEGTERALRDLCVSVVSVCGFVAASRAVC